jgi:hypothetical protein
MATPAFNTKIYKTSGAAISLTDEATSASADRKMYTISTSSKRYLDIDTAVVVQAEHDEVQTVTLTGSPAGGDFTLTFGANTTSAIAYNASAATVKTRLEALASIGAGNVDVTGSNGGPWTVEFKASLGNASQSLLTKDASGLTGGSSPNVAIARVQAGSAFATVSSTTYTLIYPGGTVIFASAQAQGTTVRLHSGKYYVYATVGGGHAYESNNKLNLEDTTEWNTDGATTFTPTVREGSLKLSHWYINAVHQQALIAGQRLIMSAEIPIGRFEGYCYYNETTLKGETKGVLDQDIAFQFSQQFYIY